MRRSIGAAVIALGGVTILVIVQARLSSRRLPGKVLTVVHGKPLIAYLLERLARCQLVTKVVVATSVDESDNLVAAFCHENGIYCYRDSLDDVLVRLLNAAREQSAPAFVRLSADSPLMDPALVDRGISDFDRGGADLVTNVHPRSFPKGCSVEVISCSALRDVAEQTLTADDREHVTRYFYASPERYQIRNFSSERPLGHLQLSVDTPEDFSVFQRLIGSMRRSHVEYGLLEIVEMHAALQLPRS